MVSSIRMWFFGHMSPIETHLYCSKQKKMLVLSPSKWGHQPHFSWSRWRVTLNADCCRSLSNIRIISIRLWSQDPVDWSDMQSVGFTLFKVMICDGFLNGLFLSIDACRQKGHKRPFTLFQCEFHEFNGFTYVLIVVM